VYEEFDKNKKENVFKDHSKQKEVPLHIPIVKGLDVM
jgi:hypothetical protein